MNLGDHILVVLCLLVSMLWITKGGGGVLVAALLTAYCLAYMWVRHQDWWKNK